MVHVARLRRQCTNPNNRAHVLALLLLLVFVRAFIVLVFCCASCVPLLPRLPLLPCSPFPPLPFPLPFPLVSFVRRRSFLPRTRPAVPVPDMSSPSPPVTSCSSMLYARVSSGCSSAANCTFLPCSSPSMCCLTLTFFTPLLFFSGGIASCAPLHCHFFPPLTRGSPGTLRTPESLDLRRTLDLPRSSALASSGSRRGSSPLCSSCPCAPFRPERKPYESWQGVLRY